MESESSAVLTSVQVKELNDDLDTLREKCHAIELQVRNLKNGIIKTVPETNPEVPANLTLAFRHLEDARMRLGKAIRYLGDGVSVYDSKR